MSSWKDIVVFAIVAVLIGIFALEYPRLKYYWLLDHDHDDVMASSTFSPSRTLTVLFVGDSLTFVHDIPAQLVNIASSDPNNDVRLVVKGETFPNADLGYLFDKTNALAWARAHHPDYVVLQEHGEWYTISPGLAERHLGTWTSALKSLGTTPVFFEVWSDCDGSAQYSDRQYAAYGQTPATDTKKNSEETAALTRGFGISEIAVGDAFERAREMPGAPDLCGPDHHHASLAGAYLAAVVFYRFFTGRTGEEATYRPWGLGAGDKATLVRASVGAAH